MVNRRPLRGAFIIPPPQGAVTDYQYSLDFYDRYYRPNNSIIVVVGDFEQAELERLIERGYSSWERGDYEPQIPVEPPQTRSARRRSLGPIRRCRF